MKVYKIILSKDFAIKQSILTKGNITLKQRIDKTLRLIASNPFYPSLKTHKVVAKNIGPAWSSSVTGDIRIIWEYDKYEQLVIVALSIGTHTGTHRVYD